MTPADVAQQKKRLLYLDYVKVSVIMYWPKKIFTQHHAGHGYYVFALLARHERELAM